MMIATIELKTLRFYPKYPKTWFEELEKRKVATDDACQRRASKQVSLHLSSFGHGVQVACGVVFGTVFIIAVIFAAVS